MLVFVCKRDGKAKEQTVTVEFETDKPKQKFLGVKERRKLSQT